MAVKKDITLAKIKAKSKQLDKMEKYEIDEGEYAGSTISFYPIFTEPKIEELLQEYQILIKEAEDKKIELSDQMTIHLLQFLTVKHFTHFQYSIPSELIGEGKKEGLLDWLEHFRKTGLYELIVNEIFLQSEVKKVFDRVTTVLGADLFIQGLEGEIQKKSQAFRDKFSKEVETIEKPLQ